MRSERGVACEARVAAVRLLSDADSVASQLASLGVVQRTTGSGMWCHVELDSAPGTTKAYRRGQLDIDKSPRKPAARKPAAKKKPSKKKARK